MLRCACRYCSERLTVVFCVVRLSRVPSCFAAAAVRLSAAGVVCARFVKRPARLRPCGTLKDCMGRRIAPPLGGKHFVEALDEELRGFFELVDVQTFVDAVNARLVVQRIDERTETEDVVGQRIVEARV